MNRRGFLGGLFASLAAPTVIRTPGILMPVRPLLITSAASSGLVGVNSLGGYMYSLELADILREAVMPLTRFRAAAFDGRPFVL